MKRNEQGWRRRDRLVATLDRFVFVKNGYSVWKHIVPIAIEALLLLLVSVELPEENLLRQLLKTLERKDGLWLAAAFLTVAAGLVYVATIRVQVKQAYLLSEGDRRRTACTSACYVLACTLIAYVVLQSVPSVHTSFEVAWACLLLALLSLTGIGWSGPGSWVESVGVKSPDYTEGRLAARGVAEMLSTLRSQARGSVGDVDGFAKAVETLRSSIKTNLAHEPVWASRQLEQIHDRLYTLTEQTKKHFPIDNESAVAEFAIACRYQDRVQHEEFISALGALVEYWPEWGFEEQR
ncbi:MAG TPA: hypothetical protein VM537_24080 [Anaerolineae bacterium]|nr:hypothetical protein [Anaerolineae bacterium]